MNINRSKCPCIKLYVGAATAKDVAATAFSRLVSSQRKIRKLEDISSLIFRSRF